MAVVPDVSAILGQAFDDEDATLAEAVIAAIARDEAIVPTLFWYEIRNVLVLNDTVHRLTAALSGRYRLDRELGQGGMATVYLAHDLKHDRVVASLPILRNMGKLYHM